MKNKKLSSIFDYNDYRHFIRQRFTTLTNGGRGQSRNLAIHLNTHSSLISQILMGKKQLTLDQAAQTCEFLGLSTLETDYFIALVQRERAGNSSLRSWCDQNIIRLQNENRRLKNHLGSEAQMNEAVKAVFYSDWVYPAFRQLTAIPEYNTIEKVAKRLSISIVKANKVAEFLINNGLCMMRGNDLRIGPRTTFLDSTSPWIKQHHTNWRLKAIENLEKDTTGPLQFSCLASLSRADAEKIRSLLIEFSVSVDNIIEPSKSEEVYCLNFDWFKL